MRRLPRLGTTTRGATKPGCERLFSFFDGAPISMKAEPITLISERELGRLAGRSQVTVGNHRRAGRIQPAAQTSTGQLLYPPETVAHFNAPNFNTSNDASI